MIAPLAASTYLLAAATRARTDVLAECFKVVPDDYLTRSEDGRATISCPCGAEVHLSVGEMEPCDCGRVFYFGTKVYAAPAPEQSEHACAPARVTCRNGATVLSDYCHDCGRDL